MRYHTDKEMEERYDGLPPDVRELIYSPNTVKTVQEIGSGHKLHIDKIETLNFLVSEAMLGFVSPEEFPDTLVEELGVSKEDGALITGEINEKIFLPIRELLKKSTAPAPAATSLGEVAADKEEPMDRAAILKEIEDSASTPPSGEPPAPKNVVVPPPQPAPLLGERSAEQNVRAPSATPEPKTPDIVREKLGGATLMTTEHVQIGRDRSSYKTDPYREPVE